LNNKDNNFYDEAKEEKEHEKLKTAQYHLEIYKSIPEYLLRFIIKNFQYINYTEHKKLEYKDCIIVEKTEEEKEMENKAFHQSKVFFDIFESKNETMVSLLRIAYILYKNNNFLMIDDKLQQEMVIVILEWIQLQSRYLMDSTTSYHYHGYEEENIENIEKMEKKGKGKEEEEEEEENYNDSEYSTLIDGINLAFKLIECYIQINNYNSALLYDLFFYPKYRKNYKMEIIIQYLISHCMPKETGWKILNWITKEMQKFTKEMYSNLSNMKNSNTKLIIQSFLLNNQHNLFLNNNNNKEEDEDDLDIDEDIDDDLDDNESDYEAICTTNLSIEPRIQNQEKIREHLRFCLLTILEFSEYYMRGIEQDDEEIYGDVKQKIIQHRLYMLQTLLLNENHPNQNENSTYKENENYKSKGKNKCSSKKEKIIEWMRDIIKDEEAEMDYHEKARKLEILLVDTCSSMLSLRNVYELLDAEKETEMNYYDLCRPIFKLLSKLWES